MLFYLYYLLIPLFDLSAEPVCPGVNTLTRLCADGEDFDVRIELCNILSALIKVEVKVRHNVDLIYQQYIADGEHKGVLEGLIVSFRHGQNHCVLNSTGVEFGGTYQVADILKNCEINVIGAQAFQPVMRIIPAASTSLSGASTLSWR